MTLCTRPVSVDAGLLAPVGEIRTAMREIGFIPENRYYQHAETDYLVEFPTGPPAVGKEPVRHIDEMVFSTGLLRILSPTDCVKDRLAADHLIPGPDAVLKGSCRVSAVAGVFCLYAGDGKVGHSLSCSCHPDGLSWRDDSQHWW